MDACLGNADTPENQERVMDVLQCTEEHLPKGGDTSKCGNAVQCYCEMWEGYKYMVIDGSPQCVRVEYACPPDTPKRCDDDACHECCVDGDCENGVCVSYECSAG